MDIYGVFLLIVYLISIILILRSELYHFCNTIRTIEANYLNKEYLKEYIETIEDDDIDVYGGTYSKFRSDN